MWEEIEINNITGIEEFVGIWNNRDGCTYFLDIDLIKEIIENRDDAHCYIFRGTHLKMIMLFRHHVPDNTTYIFIQNSNIVYTNENYILAGSEVWDAYRDFIKMLLEKYNRPVRMVKWEKSKRIQSVIDYAPVFYAQYGIKATNLEHEWFFELM